MSLETGLDKLQALEDDICRLQERCSSLLLDQKAILTFIECYKALLSPFNKVPSDVLREIFYHCLPVAHNAITSIHEPPLCLGQVSRRWRDIVYSTPKLWTSLHLVAIPLDSPPSPIQRALLDAIESWLSRSGALTLSISLYHDVPSLVGERTTNSQVQPFLDIIARHAHRWKSVHFTCRDVDWIEMLGQFHFSDVPMLEYLHLIDYEQSSSWTTPEEPGVITALARGDGILRAPRLHSLALPSYLAHNLQGDMQWQHLTVLDITYRVFYLDEFAKIASQCRNLIECTIAFTYATSSWDDGAWLSSSSNAFLPPSFPFLLEIPSLRSLAILAKPTNDYAVCDLFERISTPALVHLTWERSLHSSEESYVSWLEERMVQSLTVFLSRLIDPLEELDLSLDPVTDQTLVDILVLVPQLKRLALGGSLPPPEPVSIWAPSVSPWPRCYLGDLILDKFTPGINENGEVEWKDSSGLTEHRAVACLCPNLEVVLFQGVVFTHGPVTKFLRSRTSSHRQNGIARLRKVTIIFNSCMSQPTEMSEGEDEHVIEADLMRLEREMEIQIYLEYRPQSTVFIDPPHSYSSYEGIISAIGNSSFQRFFIQ
ncbi:hypothetical protein D9756_009987 [Leucocoprinus leucothites]|uniref:F-box domain-containing protein n=1 Tax=Leucocoprinus leucothites TaxID=201217 RepID=A0A8H5CSU5_9AGAR|nr:hypothetical protein D9756_009987 [Leucoagaricus leucothites]